MRRLLLGSASLFALVVGTPVKAADMRVLPPASAAPGFSWTGAYVGANVGGAWGHADLSTSGDCSAPTSPPGYFCSQAAGGEHSRGFGDGDVPALVPAEQRVRPRGDTGIAAGKRALTG